ncbi:hypothetical protein ICM_05951 [Bacillus cereus BAG1X2-3]|uniref:Methylamine utilisation protein MauE domain-containing protein n=1 Tax=Bacillus cereus TaxID=1396 RepID=A0A9X7E8L5_BACCE|nr:MULTISPECIES: MauE/DoxX family redox-associated membrane protein [Bacillus cereus group]EOO25061.1 hypothetical protein ICC_04982 [Bacillus cereus BAG1X1-1]EOO44048.1 hypothetical protein ICI_05479 [Bacillus cereus BAG1X2-1]EOO46190.1 hypothetical protein ICK_05532 [Bacillus cereus BAG1X2-2]EOO62637.1 hypothetical protein ICM_05951 [Bacillus cereus BAG1X2-3]EOP01557.1 hypothetical protein ICO_05377 [Bacillus cereus BAG2O-1]
MEFMTLFFRYFLFFLFFSVLFKKTKSFHSHLETIKSYAIINEGFVYPIAIIEIILQLYITASFLLGIHLKQGIILAMSLLTIYTIGIFIKLQYSKNNILCGCGGILGNHPLSWKLIIRNLLLLLISIFIYLYPSNLMNLDWYINFGEFKFKAIVVWSFLLAFFVAIILSIINNVTEHTPTETNENKYGYIGKKIILESLKSNRSWRYNDIDLLNNKKIIILLLKSDCNACRTLVEQISFGNPMERLPCIAIIDEGDDYTLSYFDSLLKKINIPLIESLTFYNKFKVPHPYAILVNNEVIEDEGFSVIDEYFKNR